MALCRSLIINNSKKLTGKNSAGLRRSTRKNSGGLRKNEQIGRKTGGSLRRVISNKLVQKIKSSPLKRDLDRTKS